MSARSIFRGVVATASLSCFVLKGMLQTTTDEAQPPPEADQGGLSPKKEAGAGDASQARLAKKARLESSVVKIGGRKLRAGTVPWRPGSPDGNEMGIQILLIEGLNTPGKWTFPAGSLDPGEEVSACAARETSEESGASGTLGCFLGSFDTDKNRTYMFLLHVEHLEDDGNEAWHDPHSSYETSGLRRRRWFHVAEARPMLKKEGPQILDAFLAVPGKSRQNLRWRLPREPPQTRLLVLGPDFLRGHSSQWGCVLEASYDISADSKSLTDAQRFAAVAAALWEADVAVFCGGAEILYTAGLSAGQHLPTLMLVTGQRSLPILVGGDSRVASFILGSESSFPKLSLFWLLLLRLITGPQLVAAASVAKRPFMADAQVKPPSAQTHAAWPSTLTSLLRAFAQT